jgi:flagellar basal-body rod modification protein FlgD
LEANAAMTAVSIYDATGGFVNSFETGPLGPGRQSAIWDGTDFNGNQMPAGAYSFEIQAVDATSERVRVRPLMSAMVTGVSFKDKTAYLMTELQSVALDDVIDVLEASPPAASATIHPAATLDEHINGGL